MAKILIIEDDPDQVKLIKVMLEASGYYMIASNNAEDGIKVAQEEIPDLILMDMILPGMHGLEATLALKKMDSTKDIPVIALTAVSSADFIKECYHSGIVAFVKKPFEAQELIQAIQKHLKPKQKVMKRVLLINYESTMTTMLVMKLIRLGYKVNSVSDSAIGVDLAKKYKPELILLDVFSPSGEGIEVFNKLKSNEETSTIPVVLMSSQQEQGDLKTKAESLGAADYIPYPVEIDKIVSRIKGILE